MMGMLMIVLTVFHPREVRAKSSAVYEQRGYFERILKLYKGGVKPNKLSCFDAIAPFFIKHEFTGKISLQEK